MPEKQLSPIVIHKDRKYSNSISYDTENADFTETLEDWEYLTKTETSLYSDQLIHNLKIIVIGNATTGKTALIHRFVKAEFLDSYKNTVSREFELKTYFFGRWELIMDVN
jgi:hypothetical protein